MTYFVFIESSLFKVPHMEPLVAQTPEESMAEARDLMGLHSSAVAAHVFRGDDRVGTIRRDGVQLAFEVHEEQRTF